MQQRPIQLRYRFRDPSGVTGFLLPTLEEIERGYFDKMLSAGYELLSRDESTGLLDKNGKEIYEGDILSSEYPRTGCKNCHPVMWQNGCWDVDHLVNDCCRPWRGDLNGHHISEEVVGNIHENPELLNPTT